MQTLIEIENEKLSNETLDNQAVNIQTMLNFNFRNTIRCVARFNDNKFIRIYYISIFTKFFI